MRDRIITIRPPYPWVLHAWIQPTTDGKYVEKKKKFQKAKLGFAAH